MPLPTPNSGESEDDFISRCMANDTMNADFPDRSQRAAVCYSQYREKEATMVSLDELVRLSILNELFEEVSKAASVNRAGVTHANNLIDRGEVNTTSSWSFDASDGNALLGPNGDDWANYGRYHLATDPDAEPNTKAKYKYPFGKGGKVYRAGLVAIRQRAGQQGEDDVFNAAGRLLNRIDE